MKWRVYRKVKADESDVAVETLTGAAHYHSDYVAVVDCDTEEVICDNADYYAKGLSPEHANLIASAPEMLDALEKLAKLGNGDSYGNSEGNMIARAAIAKAKEKTK